MVKNKDSINTIETLSKMKFYQIKKLIFLRKNMYLYSLLESPAKFPKKTEGQ